MRRLLPRPYCLLPTASPSPNLHSTPGLPVTFPWSKRLRNRPSFGDRTMTRMLLAAASAAALLALGACGEGGGAGQTREGIWAAGSSTVFPFATRVAENFNRTAGGAAPRVESLGTGGGIKAFCRGVGPTTPDLANASRPMKASEFAECQKNGVTAIVEIKIGYDGIVVATARDGGSFDLRLQDLYLGLAKEVPGEGGAFVANPATTWQAVNPALPAQRIQVYGP